MQNETIINMNIHRNQLNFFVSVSLALFVFSCASKRDSAHDNEGESEWREMDEFHMIMAETFHPFRDSANLDPVRSRASELMTAADQWASAPLPEKVDNREMREKLQQLKSEATTLAESVRSADDNVIGEQLTKVHDTFHAIQDGWYRRE